MKVFSSGGAYVRYYLFLYLCLCESTAAVAWVIFFFVYVCICKGVYLSLTLRRCYSGVVVEQWSSGPG